MRCWGRRGQRASSFHKFYDTACLCQIHDVSVAVLRYTEVMPKLWNKTIEAHRQAVHEATLNTAAVLVAKHGLRSVTMSQIAEETGIGRATLYKYFPDVESILVAWHQPHVAHHLEYLAEV